MMEELRAILITHAKRYPLMQPTDAVKLIYQNEFGGGHLIRDEQACLNYLRREYASVEKDSSVPLYEDIGSGKPPLCKGRWAKSLILLGGVVLIVTIHQSP